MISYVCILYIYREREVHAVGVLMMFDLSSCPIKILEKYLQVLPGILGNFGSWISRKDLRKLATG